MMDSIKKIAEMMTAAIFEVFEKMFFVFLEPLEGETRPYDMVMRIRFSGPQSGEMILFLSRGLAGAMVQNMLGVGRDDITEAAQADIGREALNMICGNFLRKLDVSKVYDLTIPVFEAVTGHFPSPATGAGDGDVALTFDADGDGMGVILKLTPQKG